jgi:hypothetical protein
MRVDTVGVGDVGEMSNKTWRAWDSTGGDDGGRAGIKHDPGVVGGYGSAEHHSSGEQGRHGLGVSDGAWGEHGAGVVYRQDPGGSDRMRGDTVGVGDISEVQGRTRGWWYASGGDDGRADGRERESGMVSGCLRANSDSPKEPIWDGIDICDGAWGEHGAGVVHKSGEPGAHRMRGDTMGVGDIGEMHGRTRGSGLASPRHHGRGAGRECEPCVVIRPRVDKHHAKGQPCWDGIEIGDGARSEHGACVVHGSGERGADRMQVDTVGLGDVGEVSSGPWRQRIKTGGHHGGRASGQRHSGLVSGYGPD